MNIKLSEHFTYGKLLRFSFPSIMMMIVSSVYTIVDGFFVSRCVGKNAFAAINLIMPILMAIGAIGFMAGTGGSALIAKTLGEGHKDKANRYFTMITYTECIATLIVSAITFVYIRQISELLGASELIIDDCVLYGRILLASMVFFVLQNSFLSFLVTAEKPRIGFVVSVASGIMNVVLDFVLVYVLKTGLAGAAAATAAAQITGAVVPLAYFALKKNKVLYFVKTKPDFKAIGHACANGASEMLTNLSASVVGILYNAELMRVAAENGVAAYGVIMYVSYVFNAIFFGYAISCGPIVGYHYGAKNDYELQSFLRKSLVITAVVSAAMTVTGIAFARPIAEVFVGYDRELCDMTANALRLYNIAFSMCGFNVFASAFFTGLNDGKTSAIISVLRTLIIQVAAIKIFPVLWGVDGIWLAIVAAEGVTLAVSAVLFAANRKKYNYI